MAGYVFAMGCGNENVVIKKRQFFIEVDTAVAEKSEQSSGRIAVVRAFRISRPYNGNKLVYKAAASRYEIDYYNEFAVSPGEMLAEQARSWFEASGVFKVVSAPGLATESDIVIEASVKKLYADLSVVGEQSVLMDVEFLLYDSSGTEYELIDSNSYSKTIVIADRKVESIIKGYKSCFESILKLYMNDVTGKI